MGVSDDQIRKMQAKARYENATEEAKLHRLQREAKLQEANKEIVQHKQKREVENKVLEYQLRLEEEESDEDIIEEKVAKKRAELFEEYEKQKRIDDSNLVSSLGDRKETHTLAAQKDVSNKKLANAFGIRLEGEVENSNDDSLKNVALFKQGESFNPEYQAKRKQERLEAAIEKEKKRETR